MTHTGSWLTSISLTPATSTRSALNSLEALLKRDRRIVLATIFGLVALSWSYLVLMVRGMKSGDMTMMVAPDAWGLQVALTMFLMWSIMMVGMMLPSAAPMILLHAALSRQSNNSTQVHASTQIFLLGYLVSWAAFSAAATALQWWLSSLELLSPMMVGTNSRLNGAVLIAAGIFQWLPIKTACLQHCQSPRDFSNAAPKTRPTRCLRYGSASRRILPRLLLGPHALTVCGRRHEPAVDRRLGDFRSCREAGAVGNQLWTGWRSSYGAGWSRSGDSVGSKRKRPLQFNGPRKVATPHADLGVNWRLL